MKEFDSPKPSLRSGGKMIVQGKKNPCPGETFSPNMQVLASVSKATVNKVRMAEVLGRVLSASAV